VIVWTALNYADQAMNRFTEDLYSSLWIRNLEPGQFLLQLFFALPVAMYFFSMMVENLHGMQREKDSDERYSADAARYRGLPQAMVYATLTPIVFIYVVYFLTQLPYFLSGFAGELPEPFTYSEYAVQGFYELLGLAVLNLGLIILMRRFTRNSDNRRNLPLRVYSFLLCATTLFLVTSASSKLILYILSFGLTRQRVIASFVLAGVAAVFLFALIWQFFDRFPVIRASAVALTALFLVLVFGRIDYRIAQFNIEMYKQGFHETLDSYYLLYELGEESLLYIMENDEGVTLQRAYAMEHGSWDSLTVNERIAIIVETESVEDDHWIQNRSNRRLYELVFCE